MTSRKQEERNEKIIRGLMKLPPNRRCINCNSLGPQYVCTNFQTFVCMTCSGIHREFTHRVKSVSMSKFTSQEVESLQEGGNQRAREIFLKDWDPRQQRLPDSSNADKVREFIKSVYVERKYSGTNTSDKPPRDVQNLRNHEDETRRASSYHSYSQSPPYDYQYEERRYGEGRYGKHAPALTRRSGSDRRNYEGRILSFLSPSRLRDHVHEDRLASEGSSARASDYSTSSGGDPFRSGIQSPTFPRDNSRFSSPSSETSRDILSEDVQQYKVNTSSDLKGKSDADQAPRLQRAALSDSFEAFSSNSVSFKSADSVSEQHAEAPHSVSNFSSLRQSSQPENSDGLELFSRPFVPQSITSTASAIDLFQLADTSSTLSVDFFHPSPPTSMVLASTPQQLQAFPPSSSELFSAIPYQQSAAILTDRSPELSFEKNEGWATFDVPQHVEPSQSNEGSNVTMHSTDNGSLGNFGQSLNSSFQWSYQDSSANGASSSMHNPWIEGPQYLEGSVHATSNQSWSAFDDSAQRVAFHDIDKQSGGQDAVQIPSIADQYLVWDVSEGSHNNQMGTTFVDSGPSVLIPQSHSFGSANASSALPVMAATRGNGVDQKSNNPFDLPFDFGNESSNTFLDMTSFQAELPDSQIPTSFINGVTNPWFPQGSVVPYVPTRPQGGLGFMAGQASSTQIPNIPSEGPIGRNPFE